MDLLWFFIYSTFLFSHLFGNFSAPGNIMDLKWAILEDLLERFVFVEEKKKKSLFFFFQSCYDKALSIFKGSN